MGEGELMKQSQAVVLLIMPQVLLNPYPEGGNDESIDLFVISFLSAASPVGGGGSLEGLLELGPSHHHLLQ